MYSTVNNYRHCRSRQQIISKALTIDSEAKTDLREIFDPAEIDDHLTEAKEFLGDRLSDDPEEKKAFYDPESAETQNNFLENNYNLSRLENDIKKLEISLSQTIERKPDLLPQRFTEGMENLQAQSEHINAIAAQLEAEILKFKELANQVNRDYHAIQDADRPGNSTSSSSQLSRTRPANIWEIRNSAIPTVVKQGNQFILTTKPVREVAEDSAENRVKKAQQRQKALECWLEAKRQRIIEDFSRP